MASSEKLIEKYESQGLPSVRRPDIRPPEGWSLSLITSVERIRNHRLSPDGKTIACIKDGETNSDVFTMPSSGGWLARVSTDRGLVAYWDDEVPQWSADGRWLAFTIDDHVHVVPAAGGIPKKITDFTTGAFGPKWMPDSHGLVIGSTRHEADQLLLTDRTGTWPRPLTDDGEGDHWEPDPAPDGSAIAFTFRSFADLRRTEIRRISLPSGEITTLYGKAGLRAWMPRWSADGAWIAFISQESGWNELWLIRPDGEGLHQLTSLGADVSDLEWSPDSSRIACTVNHAGSFDLFLVEIASGAAAPLLSGLGLHSRPQWTPDGKSLTFEYESPILPPDIYRIDVADKRLTQLTFSNSPALSQNGLVTPELVQYKSKDGLEIPAFLFKPEKSNRAGIVHPHGGPSSLYAAEWDPLAQYLVAKGYTFLAPNYRGSTGFGLEFEHANYGDWGGGDLQDCLAGARFLSGQPGLDAARLAILGGSYGGYMTACALTLDPDYLFACGVAKYGDANLLSSWAQCKRELRLYTEIFLGHPSDKPELYAARSPVHQVERVKKPVLVLHGLLDDVVPPEASEEWVAALRSHGKTFEYKTYANEPHGFLHRLTQLDAYARIERFLDWHLVV
jgi:dipeptidyl aminopeptidase/acylaminoacyl peptidase